MEWEADNGHSTWHILVPTNQSMPCPAETSWCHQGHHFPTATILKYRRGYQPALRAAQPTQSVLWLHHTVWTWLLSIHALLWTPNLPYRIPATVLQILPLVANLWGCRWDKFVLFIFHFRLLFTLFVLFECLCLRAKVCWVLYWNKCARHAGSGQCFRPALFWRHHTRLGIQFLGCHGMWP